MPKPELIVAMVKEQEDHLQQLHVRMEADYRLYRLEETLPDQAGDKPEENKDFRIFTANEPQTYADKIIAWLVDSKMIMNCYHPALKLHPPQVDANLKRFYLGSERAANERLRRMSVVGQSEVRSSLASFIALRGWYATRALLRKDDDGKSFIDITPWDPLHVTAVPGKDGFEWACYRIPKTPGEIKAEYGITIREEDEDCEEGSVWVYDYYDGTHNQVTTKSRPLKKRTPHGSPRVPVVLGAVPNLPMFHSNEIADTTADYGESVFKAVRNLYKNLNFAVSIWLELGGRSRKPPTVITSPTGEATLEESPWSEASETSLPEGVQIQALELLKATPDLDKLVGIINGMMQRGSLPHTVYGEIPFQLSGFAINTLKQGIGTVISPRLHALKNAYTDIFELLRDQYATGAFRTMELTGQDDNREYFSEDITPDQIRGACDIEIELLPILPEDDQVKIAIAQMMRDGPTPLFDDTYIREQVMGVLDADKMDEVIKAQTAERALPEAQLMTMWRSSDGQGDEQMARVYMNELRFVLAMKAMQRDQLQQNPAQGGQNARGQNGGGQNGASQNGGPPTFDPRVAPNAALGVPPPAPTPQGGPLVPPGQPRPGATAEPRLFGPSGEILA
jgi:hypothetical protein